MTPRKNVIFSSYKKFTNDRESKIGKVVIQPTNQTDIPALILCNRAGISLDQFYSASKSLTVHNTVIIVTKQGSQLNVPYYDHHDY